MGEVDTGDINEEKNLGRRRQGERKGPWVGGWVNRGQESHEMNLFENII